MKRQTAPPRTISVTEVRAQFAGITAAAPVGGERIMLWKRGEAVGVIVPPSDLDALNALEALEDRLDLLAALDALADFRASGGVDFDRLKGDLGP